MVALLVIVFSGISLADEVCKHCTSSWCMNCPLDEGVDIDCYGQWGHYQAQWVCDSYETFTCSGSTPYCDYAQGKYGDVCFVTEPYSNTCVECRWDPHCVAAGKCYCSGGTCYECPHEDTACYCYTTDGVDYSCYDCTQLDPNARCEEVDGTYECVIPSECSDDDDGKNYFKKGTCTDGSGCSGGCTDKCVTVGGKLKLKEYFCSDGSCNSTTYDCDNFDTCVDNGKSFKDYFCGEGKCDHVIHPCDSYYTGCHKPSDSTYSRPCSGADCYEYREYYCPSSSPKCAYHAHDCSQSGNWDGDSIACNCDCGGYDVEESIANGNCYDEKDNDCDGLTDGDDPDCQIEIPEGAIRVFVTSSTYNGNLGGLGGADQKCQQAAEAAGLGGKWIAWLSTTSVNAKNRIPDTNVGYYRLDGVKIADDKADLTDGNISNPINVDDERNQVNARVWTSTNSNGMRAGGGISDNYCNNWKSGSYWYGGGVGNTSRSDSAWTYTTFFPPCDRNYRLYCFEHHIPSIESASVSPDPVEPEQTATVTVDWHDYDINDVKIWVCKSDSFDESSKSCSGGEWCSIDYTSNDPASCTLTAPDTEGTYDYYIFICDKYEACSSSGYHGTFSVESPNQPPSVTLNSPANGAKGLDPMSKVKRHC